MQFNPRRQLKPPRQLVAFSKNAWDADSGDGSPDLPGYAHFKNSEVLKRFSLKKKKKVKMILSIDFERKRRKKWVSLPPSDLPPGIAGGGATPAGSCSGKSHLGLSPLCHTTVPLERTPHKTPTPQRSWCKLCPWLQSPPGSPAARGQTDGSHPTPSLMETHTRSILSWHKVLELSFLFSALTFLLLP